MTRFSTQRASK